MIIMIVIILVRRSEKSIIILPSLHLALPHIIIVSDRRCRLSRIPIIQEVCRKRQLVTHFMHIVRNDEAGGSDLRAEHTHLCGSSSTLARQQQAVGRSHWRSVWELAERGWRRRGARNALDVAQSKTDTTFASIADPKRFSAHGQRRGDALIITIIIIILTIILTITMQKKKMRVSGKTSSLYINHININLIRLLPLLMISFSFY